MMNLKFDIKQFKNKFQYLTGSALGFEDSTLQIQAQNYKRGLSNQLYPIEKNRITEKLPNLENYLISRKIDGEFCLVFFDGEQVVSCNPGGTVRIHLPCLDEVAHILKESGISEAKFAAEFYLITKERERVHDVIRIIRNPQKKQELSQIGLYIFDILEIDGQSINSVAEIYAKLEEMFKVGILVRPPEYIKADGNTKVVEIYEKWVETEGAEGLVVRHDGVGWFKIKPVHTIDCVVVGFSDSANERSGMLHDLLVALKRPDDSLQLLGKVGNGFTDEDRKKLFQQFKKQTVDSDYVETSSSYLAYEWVEPKTVIEIKCLDLITTKSRGDNIKKMVLAWDDEEKKFRGIRKMPFVSIIAPRFVRIRDDKSASVSDIPTKQVSDLFEIEAIDQEMKELELPSSMFIKREVYRKMQGEKLLVRKLLLWKTNKEQTGEYPPFVVFYTDFSSQRAEPLTTKLIPAHSLEIAEARYDGLKEEAVKKGWDYYDGSAT